MRAGLVRSLSCAITTLVVLVALLTVLGRVALLPLAHLEPYINALLQPGETELAGLRGHWRGMRPILHAERVRFGAGEARGVAVELDLLGSLRHWAPVARRVELEGLDLAITRGLEGWRLGGGHGAAPAIDWLALLDRAASLRLDEARLTFFEGRGLGAEVLGELQVAARLARRDTRYRGAVELRNGALNCASCAIELRYELDGSEGLLRGGVPHAEGPRGVVELSARRFRLPAALGTAAGIAGFELDAASGRWHFEEGGGTGRLALAARELRWPGGGFDALRLDLRGALAAEGLALEVERLAVTPEAGAATLELHEGRARLASGPRVRFRFDELDVAPSLAVIAAVWGESGVRDWIEALEPRGRVETLQGELDLARGVVSYGASVHGVDLEPHQGTPLLRNLHARLVGTERSLAVALDQRDLTLGFAQLLDAPLELSSVAGRVLFAFAPQHLGLRGEGLRLGLAGSELRGAFALSHGDAPGTSGVLLDLELEGLGLDRARWLIPKVLDPGLREWLDAGLPGEAGEGMLEHLRLAYRGDLDAPVPEAGQRAEVALALRDATFAFHPDWPKASALDGSVRVTGAGARVWIEQGRLGSLPVAGASVWLSGDGGRVEIDASGDTDGAALTAWLAEIPSAEWLPGAMAGWRAQGPFSYRAALGVPLADGADGEALSMALELDLEGLDLELSDWGVMLAGLEGPLSYRHPHRLAADGVTGRLFEGPVSLAAGRDETGLRFEAEGRAPAGALEQWLGLPVTAALRGALDYRAEMRLDPTGASRPVLEIRSDLAGLDPAWARALGSEPAAARPSRVSVTFHEHHRAIDLVAPGLGAGWLHLDDGGIRRGAVAIGSAGPPAPEERVGEELWIGGHIERLDLTGWLGGVEGVDTVSALDWRFDGLTIARLHHGRVAIGELRLDGGSRGGELAMVLEAPEIAGAIRVPVEGPAEIALERLRLPALERAADLVEPLLGESAAPAAASGSFAAQLEGLDRRAWPDMNVALEALEIGGRDYGRWRFALRRGEDELRFEDLSARTGGIEIASGARLVWSDTGRTRLEARASAGNLAEVLPRWGYAAGLKSDSAELEADLSWDGSPLAFSLDALEGSMTLAIEQGRLRDVAAGAGAGAQRVLSLLNLSKIARRLTMDFSDVFGRGISFDRLTAGFDLERGELRFREPMHVEGTGSAFRVSGSVDLIEGKLDNEMVVTLPVSQNLPWYAAYLAVVNPLAAGAVLVGERVFRAQIEQMSSAAYHIGGTLEDPELTFLRIFPSLDLGDDLAAQAIEADGR